MSVPHSHGHHADPHYPVDEELAPHGNPLWQQDHVTLHSVGIDVGSSGTQVVFSRLVLHRLAAELTSRYVVVHRELLHASPVRLTPYVGDAIDAEELGGIVDAAYAAARTTPEDVDTGVVILTGEALRRNNARRITEVLAERAGDLVTASAGHHLEARLAAFGSGAVRRSRERGSTVLNVDIGGGTTKLAVAKAGAIVGTAAFHVGGRLAVVDEHGRLARLEPAARRHAAKTGLDWSLGTQASSSDLVRVASGMADVVVEAVLGRSHDTQFHVTDVIDVCDVDEIVFSGGVAEYIFHPDTPDFDDLGRALGTAIRDRMDVLPPFAPASSAPIRATVVGASQFTIQLSGNTGWTPQADRMLPRRNLPVIRPHLGPITPDSADRIADAIRGHMNGFDVQGDAPFVLALQFDGSPRYERLIALARGVADGLIAAVPGVPLYLAVDRDIARTLGRLLTEELGVANPLLVLDGVDLYDFDYVDFGRVRRPSLTVPTTVKSLVFALDAE